MTQALKWSRDINSALKVIVRSSHSRCFQMMADTTDANNLEQNKIIIYRITSKHTWRKTWAGKNVSGQNREMPINQVIPQ